METRRGTPRPVWLGTCDYQEALDWHERLPVDRILGSENHLCVTLGKRAGALAVEVGAASATHVPLHFVDRGGHATLHNLGQLVIYPKIELSAYDLGVRDYVCGLQKVTTRLLAEYGITASSDRPEPGLFTSEGKIGFVGVRIRRGVTSHGLSLNVKNDLADFARIRSCGAWGQQVASMATHLGQENGLSLEALFHRWCALFSQWLEPSLTSVKAPTNVVACDNDLRV